VKKFVPVKNEVKTSIAAGMVYKHHKITRQVYPRL